MDQHEAEYKAIDYHLIKRLFVFLKPYKKYLLIAIIFAILASALAPLRPYLTKITIDNFISTSNKSGLIQIIILIFILITINGILQFALTYIMQWIGQKVLYDIRIQLFNHIESLSLKFYDKNPVGRLVTRVTNDVEALNDMFSQGVVMAIADFMLLLWIVGFMLYINFWLAIITFSILPFLIVATWIFKNRVRDLFRDIRLKVAAMNSFLNEFITGIATIKIFTREIDENSQFEKINRQHRDLMVKTVFWYGSYYPIVEMLSTVAIAIIIWFSAENILSKIMTIGTFIAFLQYAEMFFRPIRDLTEKYTTLQSAMASAERIFSLLDTTEFIVDLPDSDQMPAFEKAIEFRNVSFSYEPDKAVLKNVTFEVKKGETLAIVGTTGAGKTSIISLLNRFYEFQSGEILIDGTNIRSIRKESLYKRLSTVNQDVFLFSRTIEDNISLGKEEITEQEIISAAVALGASDFIEQTNDKYKSKVQERGATLSAGQQQLISFCRAYASNPEILILDEATSSIDSETEALIEKSLEKLLQGRTSIVIAHRLSTIKRANRIIVLHHGEVKEIGTHQELLEKRGLYWRLYELQYNNLKRA
jgi:ATP-binding cassette, subfamily B, multidrug efflux pump